MSDRIDGDRATAELLSDLAEMIASDRGTHGDAVEQHETAAKLWTTYLNSCGILRNDARLSAAQVARLMALLKISRDAEGDYSIDTDRDIAGYGGIAAACAVHQGQADEDDLARGGE